MKRKYMLFALPFLLSVILVLTFMPSSFAGSQEINAKLKTGNYVQNAETFLILFDLTGSMNDQYGVLSKFEQEKILVNLFNNTVPDLKLTAGLREFGENYANFQITKLDYGMAAYNRADLGKAVEKLSGPMGKTPLGHAIDAAGKDLQNVPGKIALIVFSDGEDVEDAPAKAAAAVKNQYGDRICIYTVQLGNSPLGAKVLDGIAKAGQCGIFVKGDSVNSDAGMTGFVERIFLAAGPAAPSPVVEEKAKKAPAAAAPERKVTISLNVQFDTGKAVIKPKYNNEIKKVADFMKQYPGTTATIEGHTDNVGKEAYNIKLSQKRADAIVKYLVTKLKIDKSRLKAVGYGPKKPVASNDTAEGKQQNRRVEAQLETVVK